MNRGKTSPYSKFVMNACVSACAIAAWLSGAAWAAEKAEPPTVSLARSTCLGECPVYKMTIRPDGGIEFEGIDFVRDSGRRTSKISADQYAKLADAFAGFAKFRRAYEYGAKGCSTYWTDHPVQTLSTHTRNEDRTVVLNFGCSGPDIDQEIAELTRLGKMVDDVANTAQWIGPPGAWRENAIAPPPGEKP